VKPLPDELLRQIGERLPAEQGAEMAIPSYLHRNPLLRKMAWMRVSLLASKVEQWARRGNSEEATILDYGCGTGVLLPTAAEAAAKVYAVDIVTEGARITVKELGLETVEVIDAEQMTHRIADRTVDLILAGEVLEHVDDLPVCLAALKSKLKPNGRLMVTLPTENVAYRFGRWLAGFGEHFHQRSSKDIELAIGQAGFNQLERRLLPSPLLPPIYVYVEFEVE
jgi:2-polyprenyl-3-methyl-5-hydroxy-6-metoxy-1,4-benzoquinol methylase